MQGFSSSSWERGVMSCFLIIIFVLVFSFSTVSGMVYDGFFFFSLLYVLLVFNIFFRLSFSSRGLCLGQDNDLESAFCLSIFFAYFWTFFLIVLVYIAIPVIGEPDSPFTDRNSIRH
ncbi:hypothetical protein ASPTUDRAFT_263063 [Aspergillus tubingensis CBS 134.48]|uniref:Uncharacterized protein n=1 Tax=Aspergillus tubingensis (strain CBS 134.48) TaxID=767770 RepID=A0A1L9NN33_ASPTC|nr:hypothetical protein ASPTUDRAFT_263063 [Aspergillus tubingensis CBS 134.48]